MANRQTTEQKRAKQAWKDIEEVAQNNGDVRNNYGSWARKLPSLIQVNGLGQAVAFLQAKGKPHHKLLIKHMSVWVCNRMGQRDPDLMAWIRKESSGSYRRATTEAMAYSIWLRRFAEAQDWGSAQGVDD